MNKEDVKLLGECHAPYHVMIPYQKWEDKKINKEVDIQKIKRRIVDYLHKYVTKEQIINIAINLGVKLD